VASHDPASLGWEGAALHEIGHRVESELFAQPPDSFPLSGARNEVVASTIAQHAISCLHGERLAWLHKKGEGERFFQNLEMPDNPPHPIWHNFFFVIQSYLPQRYSPEINHLFFRSWIKTCLDLTPLGYSEEEIYSALYSKLAGENLCWLFQLCDFSIDEARIIEAIRAIPPK
jgi:hypothetical protein